METARYSSTSWVPRGSEDGAGCYLECSKSNVAYFKKGGYDILWITRVAVKGSCASIAGRVHKC